MTRVLERSDVDLALLRQCLRETRQIIPEPFEIAADRLRVRLHAPAGPRSLFGRWLLSRPALPGAEDELRRLFELVTGFDLPGMVERARAFVDCNDSALRAAARRLVGLEEAGERTEARQGQPFVERTSQIAFVWVRGGSFVMGSSRTPGQPGYDPDADADERPAHRVQLTGFWMGVYPVTNAQYARFMAETGQPAPVSFADRQFNDPAQPVVTVSWEEACAFARWLTGKLSGVLARLPTEAEWEYAARGTDGRRYPWGNEVPDASRATFGQLEGRPAVVGHTPGGVSPYGVHDLAGNMWEWCLDAWPDSYAEIKANSVDPCHRGDPRGGSRVFRGGSWSNHTRDLRSACRSGHHPQGQSRDLGFRVVCGGSRQPDAP